MSSMWWKVHIRADQTMFLGDGRGAGFSRTSRTYIPASTLLGALVATLRLRENPDEATLDGLIARVRVSDAVPDTGPVEQSPRQRIWPGIVALDEYTCKYPKEQCSGRVIAWLELKDGNCPSCGGAVNQGKGQRPATQISVTRVALTPEEQAQESMLYERRGNLATESCYLVLVHGSESDVKALGLVAGNVLRIGATKSVAGRATIAEVERFLPSAVNPASGVVRIEMLTPGVFVNRYGVPAAAPSKEILPQCLSDANARILRGWHRWTTVGGWSGKAKGPKPEDAAVMAHSVYLATVDSEKELPGLLVDIGLRGYEGCGWAQLTEVTDKKALSLVNGATA